MLTWSCLQVKFQDSSPKIKDKPSWEMPETTTSNNSKELILDPANFTTISSIESGIISTFAFVSLLSDKSSEIGLESSLPSSASAPLIGSFHGHKRHWFQWLNPLSRNSRSWILQMRQKLNWWGIWVMFTWWSHRSVECIIQEWEGKFTLLQSHISTISNPTKNCIWLNTRN